MAKVKLYVPQCLRANVGSMMFKVKVAVIVASRKIQNLPSALEPLQRDRRAAGPRWESLADPTPQSQLQHWLPGRRGTGNHFHSLQCDLFWGSNPQPPRLRMDSPHLNGSFH